MTQTPRDWQKDMEICRPGIRPELSAEQTEDMLDALYYYMMKSRKHNLESVARKSLLNAAEAREQRLKEAIQSAHLSLTWCNTDNRIPHAVWYLEQALSLYPDTPAQEDSK